MNPQCGGNCWPCQEIDTRFGAQGDIWAELRGDSISSKVVDCTRLEGIQNIRDIVEELRGSSELRICVLDEVHRLARHRWDEMFLKVMEDPGIIWFAAAISLDELDPAFVERCHHVRTELPTFVDLARWTAERAVDGEINVKTPQALLALAEKSCGRPGNVIRALHVLKEREECTLTEHDSHLAASSK